MGRPKDLALAMAFLDGGASSRGRQEMPRSS